MSSEAANIIGLYRRHAAVWSQRRVDKSLEVAWLQKFRDLMPDRPAILDLGCGTGAPMGQTLLGHGAVLTGVDAAPEMIAIARGKFAAAEWILADMRGLDLGRTFDGILAWHSSFHLTPQDQRAMFPVFAGHAAEGAALMFTSGPSHGTAIGTFEGEPLYHGSLDPAEYRRLLDQNGFELVSHIAGDPDCGEATVWLAQRRAEEARS